MTLLAQKKSCMLGLEHRILLGCLRYHGWPTETVGERMSGGRRADHAQQKYGYEHRGGHHSDRETFIGHRGTHLPHLSSEAEEER